MKISESFKDKDKIKDSVATSMFSNESVSEILKTLEVIMDSLETIENKQTKNLN